MTGVYDMTSFHSALRMAKRIMVVCGAGLSAPSGLPTFRGAGGLWRTHKAADLATPEAFEATPGLVWQFYSLRRHMTLAAKPNAAHHALAQLAKVHRHALTLTQNVDGLSSRAGHPTNRIEYLHGSLFDVKCANPKCEYVDRENFVDPLVPALEINGLEDSKGWPEVRTDDLPRCPECKTGLLRPGVVWFGEALDEQMMIRIDKYMTDEPVDICIVVGTSGNVYPAAGYSRIVKSNGGKIAVVDPHIRRDDNIDYRFIGDAAKLLPEMLEPIIGKLEMSEGEENHGREESPMGRVGNCAYTMRDAERFLS